MNGKRIKQLRMEKGLSLTQLAQLAGVSKSYLSTIERNVQQNPSIQFLTKIAFVLGVDFESLIQNNEESNENNEVEDEWIQLSKEAARSGIDIEQFRALLNYEKWKQKNNDSI